MKVVVGKPWSNLVGQEEFCMLCPHCGPEGKLEQVGFSSEYETFYCNKCHIRYVAYSVGNGEFTEPVPEPPHKDIHEHP